MQNNRRKLAILFFSMVVVMIGFGMIIPILPFYIIEFGTGGSAMDFALMVLADSFVGVPLTRGFFVTSNAMLRPSVSALISRRATMGQGVAMGLNNAFMSLGRSVGPLWAGFIYDINLSYPYWSGSIIMLASFVISMFKLKSEEAALLEDYQSQVMD